MVRSTIQGTSNCMRCATHQFRWKLYYIVHCNKFLHGWIHRVFQKFVSVVNCILCNEFNASLDNCKLIQVRNFSKLQFKAISN